MLNLDIAPHSLVALDRLVEGERERRDCLVITRDSGDDRPYIGRSVAT